jgi:hypothetical protein
MSGRHARFEVLHAIPVPPGSTPPSEAARSCRSCFLLDGGTEALAVVRTTGRPVTHMKLDVLSVLQPNTPAPPGESGVLGDAEPADETLGSGFAAVFAQMSPPVTEGTPGQTLAAAELPVMTGLEAGSLPEPAALELMVPPWMPTALLTASPSALPTVLPSVLTKEISTAIPTESFGPATPINLSSASGWISDTESPELLLSPNGLDLKSTLLPQGRMQLITPTVPSPEIGADSLVSFAQGQGLDDSALQRLFGDEFKADGAAVMKAGLVPAAAWIAGGQRHAGVHPLVVDADAHEALDLPDRMALERAALSLLPAKRITDLLLPKSPSAEAADQALATAEDGRLELDLDLSALISELAPDADLKALKAEERVALAMRIGEMLAQRMVAQAQRGQWQLRFALNPQHLGRVEIDMQMRGGELEATFGALNPATRDLLQEALPKLREMLQQLGMDVASLNIGSGGTSKNGGQPTPQAKASDPNGSPASGAEGQPDVPTLQGRSPGADGWDIWV